MTKLKVVTRIEKERPRKGIQLYSLNYDLMDREGYVIAEIRWIGNFRKQMIHLARLAIELFGSERAFRCFSEPGYNSDIEARLRELLEPRKVREDDDIYPLSEFEEMCERGNFVDYDGHGEYSDGEYRSGVIVHPSDEKDNSWSHVVWYNR